MNYSTKFGLTLLSLTMAATAISVPAQAQDRARQTREGLQACRSIAGVDDRLRCYDRLAEDVEKRDGRVAVERDPIRDFGATSQQLPQEVRDAEVSTITAKITQVQQQQYQGWTFAIDTGAVWTQTEAQSLRRDPEVGATVVLTKGPLGSYIAKINDGRGFRVKRVR